MDDDYFRESDYRNSPVLLSLSKLWISQFCDKLCPSPFSYSLPDKAWQVADGARGEGVGNNDKLLLVLLLSFCQ